MPTVMDFVERTGKQLVQAFADSAMSGHPVHRGSIKETQARAQLDLFLPPYVTSGQGFVIDSFGSESRQMDIVVYERNACPRLNLGSDDASYYPCEGVCAIGEVKSGLTKDELRDSFVKISSSRKLVRKSLRPSFRKYGSSMAVSAAGSTDFLNPASPHFQLMGFVLCERFVTSPQSLMQNLDEFDQTFGEQFAPSIIVSLNDGILVRGHLAGDQSRIVWSPSESNAFMHIQMQNKNFGFLINHLLKHIEAGHTTCEPPVMAYLSDYNEITIVSTIIRTPRVGMESVST